MAARRLFLMAGGGTGGHVIPAIAVAREIRNMGHDVLFVGTERGVEARLVPEAGFPLAKVRVGGMKGLGIATKLASAWRLIAESFGQLERFGGWNPAAVFSMGGYVAGPPVIAAILKRIPLVAMEPNAAPGFTNRMAARWVARALIGFEETRRFFPAGRTEITGLPVREEFFALPEKQADATLTVLITGGSQGSRTLNNAARESWALFRTEGIPVRFIHQTGVSMAEELGREFREAGMEGQVSPFLTDMPAAFAEVDLVISRSGAGAVSELAAAGKPSVLVPFPFATDDHQLKNAQAFEKVGAAKLVLDRDWTGGRFVAIVRELHHDRETLKNMGRSARKLAHPGAARRAAEILVESARPARVSD